jgi:hypothetical protein
MSDGLVFIMEDAVKATVKSINNEYLASRAYVNNIPIFLGRDLNYYWDIDMKKPIEKYPIKSRSTLVNISLEPSNAGFG